MKKLMIKIVDLETGEEIEREMNEDEIAQHQANKQIEKIKQEEIAAKQMERKALLDKIGITEEEAKLLLG